VLEVAPEAVAAAEEVEEVVGEVGEVAVELGAPAD